MFYFWLISPQNIITEMFFGKWDCVLFGQQWFVPSFFDCWGHFCPVSTYYGLNWGKGGLQVFRCSSSFFCVLLKHCLVGRPLLGRFTTVGGLFPFVDNGSHRSSLESQSLKNGFVTISRQNSTLFHICACICVVRSIMWCFFRAFTRVHLDRFCLSDILIEQVWQ